MKNKLIRVFLNSDFRCQHDGLALIAKRQKIKVDELKKGEHIVFVNALQNKLKIYSFNGVLSYFRLKTGHIDLRIIKDLTETFNDDIALSYDKSVSAFIKKKLGKCDGN